MISPTHQMVRQSHTRMQPGHLKLLSASWPVRLLLVIGVSFSLIPSMLIPTYRVGMARAEAAETLDATHLQEQAELLTRSGRRDEAIALVQQALQLYRESGDRVGEAATLQQLGEIHTALGNYEEAIAVLHPRLAIAQEQDNLEDQSYALGYLTQVYRLMEDYPAAIRVYQQSLDVARARGLSEIEGFLLSDIAELLEKQGQTELAILFYKQSVNQRELVRQQLRRLPPGFQEPYTQSVAYTYRALADLLLQQDRVLEAQHVLDLLKVQELDDYLHDVRGSDRTTDALEFLEAEQQLLNLYDRAVSQGVELVRLREIPLGDRTPDQQQRLADLVAMEQELVLSFDEFLDRPDVFEATSQLSRTARRQNIDLAQLNALQDNLQTVDNAVLLYPLILDDRLELVVVTPYTPPIRRTIAVSRAELNEAIANFRHMLTQPQKSNWDAAQQLYDWLIRPIEDDIAAAQAETLIFAPDGALRYIPLAALRDDDAWLIERFRTTTVTAASLTDFDTPPQATLNVLAAAFSDRDSNYTVELGTRQFSFAGLPYAGLEVDLIAAEVPATTQFVNQDFNRAAIVPQMDDHTIVHLATHAEFVSGQPEESFILFGDGDRITLRDVATWTLRNVDLVVLSACQTALGGEFGNGEEILGFGYQIQRTGARAAIASLWSVDDGGTQALMTTFYRILQDNAPSKAETLRQAQLSMIQGTMSQFDAAQVDDRLGDFSPPNQSYTHPYYWASFILIGNGL